MDFTFRKASMEDLPEILTIMNLVYDSMERKDWFVIDTEDYMREHISCHGFTILAIAKDGTAAGFFLIKFPGNTEENLGHLLHFSEDRLIKTVHMDMTAVHPDFQGNHLQSLMLLAAEQELKQSHFAPCYCMATVHPDNHFSLNNMIRNGYGIQLTTSLYGGLIRHVLLKNLH
ncbi:MAG: GNAT family N-acetyltransferase [Blautia sp.]